MTARFNAAALLAALGAPSAPATIGRIERVEMLGTWARNTLDGKPTSRAAAQLLARGLLDWLESQQGGGLDHHLGVATPQGSRITASTLHSQLSTCPMMTADIREADNARELIGKRNHGPR